MKNLKLKCSFKVLNTNIRKFNRFHLFYFKKSINRIGLNSKNIRFVIKNTIKVFKYKPWCFNTELAIGNLVHACTGYNVKIAEIDIDYNPRKKIIRNIYILDTHNMEHSLYSCCSIKRTKKEIEDRVINNYNYYSNSSWKATEMVANLKVLKDKLDNGIPICDEDGIRLE